VSTHKARILEKMGMDSVADLVRYAMAHELGDSRDS
jgi:DNA-binding CsgD family transcriptional regulator